VADLTVAQLARLDAGAWYAAEFAGERIPRLVEVMELVAATATRLNVEIKASGRGLDGPGSVVQLFRQFGVEREYLVSSFDLQALLHVRAMAPEIPLALIGKGPEILPCACKHQLPWIHVEISTLDPALVAAAHDRGICVNAWTVDDPARFAYVRSVGADKICTNRPAAMLAAMRLGVSGGERDKDARH
jgi:glycerophosphoryl diester phosphodiesterase